MEIAEAFGDDGFDIPRRYFAAVAILVGVFMSALDSAIAALSFLASVARIYRQRAGCGRRHAARGPGAVPDSM
ncbi:hypothetical protein [Burkholderia cepacia]|uniref:hypothetical protein n=1 Tax=Burkholderia cepacia TaxID=292 RepID=UPI0015885BB6|nr:hypothetical protein [Burkholderia cepacia]